MLKVTKVEKLLSACYGSCSFKPLTKEKYDSLKLILPYNLHLKTFATRWRWSQLHNAATLSPRNKSKTLTGQGRDGLWTWFGNSGGEKNLYVPWIKTSPIQTQHTPFLSWGIQVNNTTTTTTTTPPPKKKTHTTLLIYYT